MAWHIARHYSTFYVKGTDWINGKKKIRYLHRMILDCPPGMQIDHIDGDGLNNRRSNLRVCSCAENLHNQRPTRGTSSRFKGVSWFRRHRKWLAYIRVDGRQKHLGLFADELEAARAYDRAAHRHYGEFARLNFTKTRR